MRLYPDNAQDMRQVDGELWNALLLRSQYKLEDCLKNAANPNARWTGEGISLHRPTPLNFLLMSTRDESSESSVRSTKKMLELLLSHGADPTGNTDGLHPFQIAAKYAHPACTIALFKQLLRGISKDTIEKPIEYERAPTLSALAHAFRSRSVTAARALMSKGADPWRMQEDGQPCWIHLLRSSHKIIDYNRHPQAAYLALEIGRARGSEDLLRVIEQEVDLLETGATRQDSYGGRAMQRIALSLGKQGQLNNQQMSRLLGCTGEYVTTPLSDLLAQGADPNAPTRNGKSLLWKVLQEGEAEPVGALFSHPHTDLCVLSDTGMTVADFLRHEKRLFIQQETRAMWIARAEQQLLDRQAPTLTEQRGRTPRL